MTDTSKVYARKKLTLSIASFIFECVILVAVYRAGVSEWFLSLSTSVSMTPFVYRLMYIILLVFFMTLVSMPFDFYGSYRIEHAYNLSRQTFARWIWDYTKKFLLQLVVALVLIEILYVFLDAFPATWWIWMWLFWNLFNSAAVYVFPYIVIPLFYKMEKLDDESIVDMVRTLAARVGFPVQAVEKINLGKDTVKANAALVGMGKSKRVILADTLLAAFTVDEIKSVVAHELGHETKRHIPKLVVAMALFSLGVIYAGQHLLTAVCPTSLNDITFLPCILVFLAVAFFVLSPLHNAYSRKLEREADAFALELTHDSTAFISMMQKLATRNCADMNPHPLVEFFFYSHPSPAKRISMAAGFNV